MKLKLFLSMIALLVLSSCQSVSSNSLPKIDNNTEVAVKRVSTLPVDQKLEDSLKSFYREYAQTEEGKTTAKAAVSLYQLQGNEVQGDETQDDEKAIEASLRSLSPKFRQVAQLTSDKLLVVGETVVEVGEKSAPLSVLLVLENNQPIHVEHQVLSSIQSIYTNLEEGVYNQTPYLSGESFVEWLEGVKISPENRPIVEVD